VKNSNFAGQEKFQLMKFIDSEGGYWQGLKPVVGNQKKINELHTKQLKVTPFISRYSLSQQQQQICVVFFNNVLQFELQNCFLILPRQQSSSKTNEVLVDLFIEKSQSSLLIQILKNLNL
jgi:hypothetical protein